MTTLAVCGDSWFVADTKYPGKSFGEILCARNDWNLMSLARGGCSNFTIGLQIDYAIKHKADVVLVNTTTWDRMEIPIKRPDAWQDLLDRLTWQGWRHLQPRTFDRARGLANVQYWPHPDLSSENKDLVDPVIISESMNNLAFDGAPNSDFYDLDASQRSSIKHYLANLYESGAKQQIDCWIMSDACRRLAAWGGKFLTYTSWLFCDGFEKDILWLPEKYRIDNTQLPLLEYMQGSARFHYGQDRGGDIATYIESRL